MRPLLVLALALWAGGTQAQVQTDAAGLREISAQLLAQGEPARARELATALLARDPDDLTALVLYARASLALGEFEDVLPAARQAHAQAEGEARFVAARIAARAHAELGHWTRAQFWLRRASEDAPNRAALEDLAQEFRAVRALNPLTVSLSFGAAPTSNINGGTSSEVIWVYLPMFGGYIPTVPVEDALPLSGLRLSGSAQLSYRVAGDRDSATFLEGQVAGRTYILSDEAKATAPGAEGSDYSDLSVSAGVVHRWQGEGASGPSALRFTLGQSWYDGEPYSRFAQVSYDRAFVLDANDRIDLSAFADWTERREEDSDGDVSRDRYPGVGLRGRWTHELASGDGLSLSLGLRDHLAEIPDTTFTGATLGAGWARAEPVLGVRLGLGAEVDWRSFDSSFLEPAGREDLRTTLRATLGVPRFQVWGFEPTVTVEASRTNSDADRIDKDSVTLDLGFRSSF